jgi:hypothetical protein
MVLIEREGSSHQYVWAQSCEVPIGDAVGDKNLLDAPASFEGFAPDA